jgi:ribonuclease D
MVQSVPSKADIAALPPFQTLGLEHIVLVATAEQAVQAQAVLAGAVVLGFDTESKPTFKVGEVSTGPHTVQLATAQRAYVFQLRDASCRQVVCDLLTNPVILKVGFGLSGDHAQIQRTLGVSPANVLDINRLFRAQGHIKEIGVKTAVALVFGQRFVKSRKATTSNWANSQLTDAQLLYAANDAWAALRVYEAMAQPLQLP